MEWIDYLIEVTDGRRSVDGLSNQTKLTPEVSKALLAVLNSPYQSRKFGDVATEFIKAKSTIQAQLKSVYEQWKVEPATLDQLHTLLKIGYDRQQREETSADSSNKSSLSVSSEEKFSRELTRIIKSQGILITNWSNIQALLSRSWDLPSQEIVKEVLITLYPDIEIANLRSNSTEIPIQDSNGINLDLVHQIVEKIIEFRSHQILKITGNE